MPVPESARPVGRPRTRDVIAARLRQWIKAGELGPGEEIRDHEIAGQLGVSRTPVREALLQLEHEGLIVSQPQGWTRVAPLDVVQWRHAHVIWVELQVLAARLVAELPDRDLSEIEAAHLALAAEVERTTDQEPLEHVLRLTEDDDLFHEAIVRATRNPYLPSTIRPYDVLVRRFQGLAHGPRSALGAETVEQHQRILDALRQGDPDAAAEAMRANVSGAYPADRLPDPDRA